MSTFTLQELNLPMTAEDALKAVEMGKALANHELAHQQAQQNMLNNINPTTEDILNNIAIPKETKDTATHILHTRHVTEPQPTLGTPVPTKPTLESVLQSIAEQFSLLSTVIKEGAQGNSLSVEDQSKSLQDCVALTLQQAEWFKDLVRHELIGGGIEDLAKDAVQEVVESEVEHYFNHRFDPSDHFDFGDAVSSEVFDRIDDAVRDNIDDAVHEQLEELVAEKLKNVRVVFD